MRRYRKRDSERMCREIKKECVFVCREEERVSIEKEG